MSLIMRVTKGDYGIDLTYTVKDSDGAALDISSATGTALLIGRYNKGSGTVEVSGTFDSDGSDGVIDFSIAAADLNITPGYYDAEVRIDYASGRRTTRTFTLHIVEKLT